MRRIITMLQDMQKELEREGEMEKELFEKAMCVCENGEKELTQSIEDSKAAIEEHSSKINAGTAEQAQLTQEIADHGTNKEQEQFAADEASTTMSIKQLGQAIPAIEKGMGG